MSSDGIQLTSGSQNYLLEITKLPIAAKRIKALGSGLRSARRCRAAQRLGHPSSVFGTDPLAFRPDVRAEPLS